MGEREALGERGCRWSGEDMNGLAGVKEIQGLKVLRNCGTSAGCGTSVEIFKTSVSSGRFYKTTNSQQRVYINQICEY